jgi:hypothetical protein
MTLYMNCVETTPADPWPHEVEMMISAMEAARPAVRDRRKQHRNTYRAVATLRLYVDGDTPRVLYTRNVDSRGIGFISQKRLPLGYGGTVELRAPDGQTVQATCTIFRCREMVNGWYEAALSFNTEQWLFDPISQIPERSMRIPP